MNWSKAKSILIVFLICANVFLLCIILNASYKRSEVSESLITSTVSLLHSKGIEISPSLIPKTTESDKSFSAENIITDYESFAKLFIGDEITADDTGYSSSIGSVHYFGDRFDVRFTDGVETSPDQKSPADKAKAYLKELGIKPKQSHITVSNDSTGLFKVNVTKTVDRKPFFDCSVTVELTKDKITAVSGIWFFRTGEQPSVSELESVPGLLVKFFSANSDFSGMNITGLTSGYAVYENDISIFHKQTVIIPVLEISTSEGQKYYVDARSSS